MIAKKRTSTGMQFLVMGTIIVQIKYIDIDRKFATPLSPPPPKKKKKKKRKRKKKS